MPFRPNVQDELIIAGTIYRVAEHPAAPGFPYGQEGRAGIVYQLLSLTSYPSPDGREVGGEGRVALKVFKPRFRTPALVAQAEKLAALTDLPGLRATQRTVLTPTHHAALLQQHPDLIYAVLMPWIEGPTWQEVLLAKRPLDPRQVLTLARELAEVLTHMEQRAIAHCDLSGPNVLLPALTPAFGSLSPAGRGDRGEGVALVDLEGVYAPGFGRPEALSSGSAGYAHREAADGLWGPQADRFAGAVLLAEMLGWCDPQVVQAAWGESYFDPAEMQRDTVRYQALVAALTRRWGESVSDLFTRAWHSQTLADCPTFAEWLLALSAHQKEEEYTDGDAVNHLMSRARQLEDAGDLEEAARVYREAQKMTSSSALRTELNQIIAYLEQRQAQKRRRDNQAQQAQAYARAGRWQEAIAIYERLLLEPAPQFQRQEWQTALEHCRAELELADLFSAAEQAVAEKKWASAIELLEIVLKRRPGYAYRNSTAQDLLAKAKREMARQAKAPLRSFIRTLLVGLLTVLALSAVGVGSVFVYQRLAEEAQQQAIAAATAQAAPWQTVTAQAQLTAQALATQQAQSTSQAEATRIALATERAQSTAQARQTAEALAAERATATLQAKQTATSIAIERMSATAQAEQTATAVAAAFATATAQAAKASQPVARPPAPPQPVNPPAAPAQPSPGAFLNFEQNLNWRRGDQPYGQLERSSEQVKSGAYAAKLSYDFPATSDNFVVFVARPAIGIPSQSTGLVAWVYGNGSGHFLNVWVLDAQGEVRSYTFGRIWHQGWQTMVAWFDDDRGWPNGNISGPSDGRLNPPAQFYALVLDGVPDGQASSGVIYIDDIFITTQPIPQPTPTPSPLPPQPPSQPPTLPPPPPPTTTQGAVLPEPPSINQFAQVVSLLVLGMLISTGLLSSGLGRTTQRNAECEHEHDNAGPSSPKPGE
jgi:cytoskeletal protein RodZ